MARSTYWRAAEPKRAYDVVIVGGGGHGLSTAYYLAKNHGIRNVAVLEKGWLGGGNTGRNTTIVRSNYPLDANAARRRARHAASAHGARAHGGRASTRNSPSPDCNYSRRISSGARASM